MRWKVEHVWVHDDGTIDLPIDAKLIGIVVHQNLSKDKEIYYLTKHGLEETVQLDGDKHE